MIRRIKYYKVDDRKFNTLQEVADYMDCSIQTARELFIGDNPLFESESYYLVKGKKFKTQKEIAYAAGCSIQWVSACYQGYRDSSILERKLEIAA